MSAARPEAAPERARGRPAGGAPRSCGAVHQRRVYGTAGEVWHCVEHTRADGSTELIGQRGSVTVWWACAPGTIWQVTAAELVGRAHRPVNDR